MTTRKRNEGKVTSAVLPEQVHILYMQAPVSNLLLILIAALLYILLHEQTGMTQMSIWVGLVISAALYRLWLWVSYNKTPGKHKPQIWLTRYAIACGVLGFFWGLLYLLITLEPMNQFVTTVLVMLYFGLVVSAYAILSIYLPAYFLYSFPPTITLSVLLLGFEEELVAVLIFLVFLFYGMVGMFAIKANKKFLEVIRLKIRNQSLIVELREEVQQRDQLVQEKTGQLTIANKALAGSEEQLKNVIHGANLGYWDWNYQTGYHVVNDRWLEILGLDRSDIKNYVSDWSERIHPEDWDHLLQLVEQHIKTGKGYVADYRMKHKDGHWVWIEGAGSVVEYDGKTGDPIRLCGTHQDISERKSLEKKLEYQATHDVLTGLLNRMELWKRLDQELERASRYQHDVSLFMIDLDHFKQINDQYGHHSGDMVLKQFTGILKSQLRKTDLATRYGGEEFVVILPETSLDVAEDLAERLRQAVKENVFQLDGQKVNVSISIGISAFEKHARTSNSLIDVADKAMYMAKEKGRDRVETGTANNRS